MCGMLCLMLISLPHVASPQNSPVRFERITEAHGLSQSFVTAVMQDSQGFMWFGTSDGLNRYDGYDFKIFRSDPTDPHSLSSNFIHCIYEDSRGSIWVGTEGGGLNRYDPATGHFTRFVNNADDSTSLSNDRIFALYEAPSQPGTLWVGTNGGLDAADISQPDSILSFRHYRCRPDDACALSSIYIRAILEDVEGRFWVGTWAGLDQLDRNTGKCTRYRPEPNNSGSIGGIEIETLHLDSSGDVWIGMHDGGVNRFDREKKHFIRYGLGMDETGMKTRSKVKAIGHDRDGWIWVGTGNGLFRMRPDGSQRVRYSHHEFNPNSLSNNGVISLYGEGSDIIWAGTNTGGVNKILLTHKGFDHIQSKGPVDLRLPQNSIYALTESRDSSGIWIGMVGGMFSFYNLAEQSLSTFSIYPENHSQFGTNHVKAIWEENESRIWLGTTGGLARFNPISKSFHHYQYDPANPKGLPFLRSILALLPDPEEQEELWISFSHNGLARFNTKTETFIYYPHDPADNTSICSNNINTMIPAGNDRLWLGTEDGLSLFDRTTGKCSHYLHQRDRNSLAHPYVKSLHRDKTGALWVGTAGGLTKMTWDSGGARDAAFVRFVHYTEEDGLPNNLIYGILEDEEGRLWLSTNRGLSRFDPATGIFENFDQSDGLQSNEFNTGAYHRCSDGRMLFGGINGFNLFYPRQIQSNTHVPPVVITDFQIFNESIMASAGSPLTAPITAARAITLSHRDVVFSFRMAALDYVNPSKNRYAYQLEGFEEKWNEIGTRRFATFTNIPPGHYTFRARACNNDGFWNEAGAAVQIRITPPWTKTPWATTLFVLSILMLLVLIIRFWILRERMKNQLNMEHLEAEKWQEVDEMKSRFFANISHEFRTPLTLILGMARQFLDKAASPEDQSRAQMQIKNGQRLLRLVNQLLDLSRIDDGRMNMKAKAVDMEALIRDLCAAFESHACQQHIDLQWTFDSDKAVVKGDKEKLEQIVSNLMTNAIKFTPPGGRVEISLNTKDDVSISIRDTGPGIPENDLPHIFDRFYQVDSDTVKKQQGTGIGLALCKELARLHQGDIQVSNTSEEGSVFTLRLPLIHERADKTSLHPHPSTAPSDLMPVTEQSAMIEEDQEIDVSSDCAHEDNDHRPCLLIVEDNCDMRHFIRASLHDGYAIREAADGKAGLAKAQEHIPDLIISDVMMPEMDGYTLCDALKTDPRTSHIPVLLLTARADRNSKLTGLNQGADDYLLKPFDADELNVRIKNLIEQRRRLKESFRNELLFGNSDKTPLSAEQAFINHAVEFLGSQLDNPDLDVALFAREMGLSRSQLYRKLQGITGQSTSEFIRSIRLKKAAALLEKRVATVTEIAYQVGFNNPPYFTNCFKEMFGVSPIEYARKKGH